MTHLEMARFQKWFSNVNAMRLRDGLPVIQTFYPYDFLRGRIRDTRETADAKQQKTTVKADAHVEFRRFVFLKATDKDIRDLVYSKENLDSFIRLRRYLDPTGHQALVRDAVMREFFQACLDYRERFELSPSLEGVKALDQVKIISGPYKGYEATVVSIKLVNGRLDLRLAIPMVRGQIDIHRKNVSAKEVVPLNPSDASALRADFIRYTQDSLLDILSARAAALEKAERAHRRPSSSSPVPPSGSAPLSSVSGGSAAGFPPSSASPASPSGPSPSSSSPLNGPVSGGLSAGSPASPSASPRLSGPVSGGSAAASPASPSGSSPLNGPVSAGSPAGSPASPSASPRLSSVSGGSAAGSPASPSGSSPLNGPVSGGSAAGFPASPSGSAPLSSVSGGSAAGSPPSSDLSLYRRHAELLTTLYRYRDYEIQNPSAEAHFTALMLICAHLCQDAKGEKELQQRALAQLEAINAKGPAKAATDTRTYLWIALKISTGDPQYRDLAKDYIRTKQPKSPQLRQFVTLISKKVRL